MSVAHGKSRKTTIPGGFMKLRIFVCSLALCLLGGAAAQAQDNPKVDVFAGYSYVRDNPGPSSGDSFSLNGGSVSVDYHITGWLGAVADFGGYHNGDVRGTGTTGTMTSYLFGPRVSLRSYHRITPFAQTLFGFGRGTSDVSGIVAGNQNAFAMTAGGGFDYKINNRLSVRPLQVEYLLTRFTQGTASNQTENNLRASAGIVVHF
jgi:opacity protein-like surface antigen